MRKMIALLFLLTGSAQAAALVGTNDIKNGSVTNAKLANMNNSTIKCNVSGSAAAPSDCTGQQVGTVVGALIGTNNLADLNSAATARTNLGLGTMATQASTGFLATALTTNSVWQGVAGTATQVGLGAAVPACSALSGTVVDWATSFCYTKTLSANTTLTFVNPVSGKNIQLRITNTGANYTLTLPNTAGAGTSVLWPGSTIPVLTTGQHSDIFTIFFDGTNYYGATPTQNY